MKGLWHTIAPFATDISGACTVFQHSKALVIAQDSNGTVSNLRRVIDINKASADFETLDLPEVTYTLGREEDFQARIRELFEFDERTSKVLYPSPHATYEFVALVNSPVPSLLGTDLAMRARLFEDYCGLPTLAIKTTGNKYYDHGIAAAYQALYDRFVLANADGTSQSKQGPEGSAPCDLSAVNVLGATELDLPGGRIYARMKDELMRAGGHVVSSFGYRDSVSSWQLSSQATCNIVATSAGFALARAMERDFGIPWIALDELEFFDSWVEGVVLRGDPRVLVVGEVVTSRLLRRLLMHAGAAKADIATFFMFDRSLREKDDVRLSGEADLHALFARGEYDFVIGDAIFKKLCPMPYFALMHPPVGFGERDETELSGKWLAALARWWNGGDALGNNSSSVSSVRRRLRELDL